MADNVQITAGTGTPIATDDVGGVHYQKFKLITGEADTAERIGDTDNGTSRALHVDVVAPPTNTTTTALATHLVVTATGGTIYGLQGYAIEAGFVQFHEAAALPANGAVPLVVIPVEADKPFSMDFGVRGRNFPTGCVIAFSSTGPTLTVGNASMWVDAQVR